MIETKYRVVLASASPRRYELLHRIFKDFTVYAANIDENIESEPVQTVLTLARNKALNVLGLHKDALVIGADTIVVHGGEVLGKPKNGADALRMLKRLSADSHTVYTGVCVCTAEKELCFFDESTVTFRGIDEREINEYIKSGSPFDKAGAYGIQDSDFVRGCDGSLYNVMGLPVERLEAELERFLNAE